MDLFEKFNNKFGSWYESLFGGENNDLRPKDVLRKIIAAMEDNRKSGLDAKIYVPNKYVLELTVDNPEERDYLLSFLDEEELMSVLKRFMAQNNYHARGPLDFIIEVVPQTEGDAKREKLRVMARFEKGVIPTVVPPAELLDLEQEDDDPSTVPAIAWAALDITDGDGRKEHFNLMRTNTKIGRSRSVGNDLVLNDDGMVSKAHARIERERDGRFTLYDLDSMNGILINGTQVTGNRVLKDHDEIVIGGTKLVFLQAGPGEENPPPAGQETPSIDAGEASVDSSQPIYSRRARLLDVNGEEEHVLASETLIGSSLTADIVLSDPSVSTRHARIISPDPATYYLEDLASEYGTYVNKKPVAPNQRYVLANGDNIIFGARAMRFQGGAR